MKKKAGIIIFLIIFILYIGIVGRMDMEAEAAGSGYEGIEQTEDCPELLQAIVFYESSNQRTVGSEYALNVLRLSGQLERLHGK